MEGAHAHHCSIQEGGSSCGALEVDIVGASSPISPVPSLQCEERGHAHLQSDSSPQLADYNLGGNDGDWQQLQGISPSHRSLNSHIEGAPGPPHLPSTRSHQRRTGSSQSSLESSSIHSPQHDQSWLSLPPCTLDPNAREFTPPLVSSLQLAIHTPLNMLPVYTAHSEIRVSHVCYQANVAAMQAQLVDTTTLRIEPTQEEIVTARNSCRDVNYTHGRQHATESGPSTLENVAVSSAEGYISTVGQHVNGSNCCYAAAEKASYLGNVGAFHTPVHERSSVPVYNHPILTNPQMGLILPPMATPFPPPPPPLPPPLMPPYPCPVTSIHPQQALTVYAHKHFHPQFGWKEHISRALLISGIPPHLTESQLRVQLEQWGDIRALYADKLPQGNLSVQFFDLRASRQALRDMQNQHLLRQQRFQEHLYAQGGMQLQNCSVQSSAAEQGSSFKGLLGGYVVWAQYITAWSVPVSDAHNQGTLVLFNAGADVSLECLQQVFEKYGYIRELREAPTKRQHKFVEFYDTRDAEAAWAALNGQEVCGKYVKIEFSRQGGPFRKQKSGPVQVHNDLVASGREVSSKVDSSFCGWQSHSTHGYYNQEWHARFFEGNPPPPPSPEMIMLPSALTGSDDCLSYGSSMSSEWRKKYVNHIQGAISGPRRKHSTARLHPARVSDVLVHGRASTLSLRPAETIHRNVSTRGHPHFEYNEKEAYLMSGEPRTTLMIKNIPNKYSQQMLLSLLDHHCGEYNSQVVDLSEPESAYDFVYLPIDFKNRCNLGYAFVNFTSALATLKFYKAFHLQAWEEFNSRKVCDIKYARVQGRHALENHFCNSRFACDTPDYLPVVFTPPRNGLHCPPPRVAAGLMMMKTGRPALAGISISSTELETFNPLESLQKSEALPNCDSTTNNVDHQTKQLDITGEPQDDGA